MGLHQSKPTWQRNDSGGVHVLTDYGLNDVCVLIMARVGSMHEREGVEPCERGVSHLLEHALFRGSSNYPKGVAESMNRIHATFNALTTRNMTCYHACAPVKLVNEDIDRSDVAQQILKPMLDLVLRPLLRDDDVEKELGIVRDELLRRTEDASGHSVEIAVRKLLGPGDPFSRTVSGSLKDIDDIAKHGAGLSARSFYNRHYTRPEIMHIVVAGPVSLNTVMRIVGDDAVHFKRLPRSLLPVPGKPRNAPDGPSSKKSLRQDHITYAWRVPNVVKGAFENVCVAKVLACVLAGTPMSNRLYKRLREKAGMTYGASAWVEWCGSFAVMMLNVTFDKRISDRGRRMVLREMNAVSKLDGNLSEDEIEAAKHHLSGSVLKLRSSAQARCMNAASMLACGPFKEKLPSLESVSDTFKRVSARHVRLMAFRLGRPKSATVHA